MTTEWSTLWWGQITGPASLVSALCAAIDSGHSVLITLPEATPWREEFRTLVTNQLLAHTVLPIEPIDTLWSAPDIESALFERFVPEDRKRQFQPHRDRKLDFLLRESILWDRLLWVRGLSGKAQQRWVTFLRKFRAGPHQGRFVLETTEAEKLALPGHIVPLTIASHIAQYDTLLFCALIARSDPAMPEPLRQYRATLAASLCLEDAQVAAELLWALQEGDPIEALRRVMERMDPAGLRAGESTHPFALLRKCDMGELHKRVWLAQLKTAFPLVEEERTQLIQKWLPQIERCLPVQTPFGEWIENPLDLEFGNLIALMATQRPEDHMRVLYIPDQTDYRRIHFLRNVRNKLAHRVPCSSEEMELLFTGEEREGMEWLEG